MNINAMQRMMFRGVMCWLVRWLGVPWSAPLLSDAVCMPLIFWGVWRDGVPPGGRGVAWSSARVGEVYISHFLYSLTYRFPITGNIYNNIIYIPGDTRETRNTPNC